MAFDPKKFEAEKRRERRVFTFAMSLTKEQRAEGDQAEPGPGTMAGHASVFDTPADLGYFVETVKPGAFTRTIAQDDIRALFNHDPNFPLGRNTVKTLELSEDSVGLAFRILLPDTSQARDLAVSVGRGDVSQCSIGFYPIQATWREEVKDGETIWYRDLTEIELLDISPVTFPAFTSTDVSMRSAEDVFKDFRTGPGMGKAADPIDWQRSFDSRRRALMIAE